MQEQVGSAVLALQTKHNHHAPRLGKLASLGVVARGDQAAALSELRTRWRATALHWAHITRPERILGKSARQKLPVLLELRGEAGQQKPGSGKWAMNAG